MPPPMLQPEDPRRHHRRRRGLPVSPAARPSPCASRALDGLWSPGQPSLLPGQRQRRPGSHAPPCPTRVRASRHRARLAGHQSGTAQAAHTPREPAPAGPAAHQTRRGRGRRSRQGRRTASRRSRGPGRTLRLWCGTTRRQTGGRTRCCPARCRASATRAARYTPQLLCAAPRKRGVKIETDRANRAKLGRVDGGRSQDGPSLSPVKARQPSPHAVAGVPSV
mmetsp:Transcript_23571/g.73794  ORF Transcript_23571/g.73794 Transcript_23571/m.73794 type:complete len:222 (+) Transcript_23571:647-1312(+)